MAKGNKFDCFNADLGFGKHKLDLHALKIALTSAVPDKGASVLADIREIKAGKGYPAGGERVPATVWTQVNGAGELRGGDVEFTAKGGDVGPFRCAVLYNATA